MNKILRNNFTVKWAPFALALTLLFSATIAQPTHAVTSVNTVKCNAITLFASVSESALQFGAATMQKTFELTISIMQGAWQLEDMAVSALRAVGESAFIAALDAFANRPGIFIKQTDVRTAALAEYKTTMLAALHLLENNIDAIRAAYREDMLALVKAHQLALTHLVANLTATITAALDVAQANCSSSNVVQTLVAVIVQANLTLLTQALAEDAKSIVKAIALVTTRNKGFITEDVNFLKTSVDATAKLAQAFLTRQ